MVDSWRSKLSKRGGFLLLLRIAKELLDVGVAGVVGVVVVGVVSMGMRLLFFCATMAKLVVSVLDGLGLEAVRDKHGGGCAAWD